MQFIKRQTYGHLLRLVIILLIAFALRVYNLQSIPNGLFTDEAARGYDAFSISQTGADMFGARWPIFLRGFDDYTAGLYVYLTLPFVFFLDLSHFSTRLASAFIGVLTVAVAYQAIRRPFGQWAGIVGAGLIAISPWHVLLSRIGTEWNLLALGPMLTIVLAYRGLSRSKWLLVAAVAGGFSLYGYAPVKAFLPLLLAGFTFFYWRDLWAKKWMVLCATIIFIIFAIPVYTFSFTNSGLTRFQEVSAFYHLSWGEAFYLFAKNYLAYFDPKFLWGKFRLNVFFIQRLKYVGLLFWFELPLILLGLIYLFKLGRREHYFWLYWLLVAPLGINLHIHSPKPALWLTSTPILHGLAAAGLIFFVGAWPKGFIPSNWLKIQVQRGLLIVMMGGLTMLAIINIYTMLNDLFVQFPRYAVRTVDWGYALDEGVQDLMQGQVAFDQVNIDAFDGIAGIYAAYYARFSPQQRHAEIAQYGQNAWQHLGPLTVGAIESRIFQPGCYLSLTRDNIRSQIPAPNVLLSSYPWPDGQPSSLVLTAIASPQTERNTVQTIFGDQILLTEYALTSAKPDTALEMMPGQAICLILMWQSAGNLTADYTVFVHLLGPPNPATGNLLWSQHDSMPAEALRPTSSWEMGELIQDMHVLFIPDEAPPGTYQLNVGLYDSATGQRLTVGQANGLGFMTLLEISVR